MSHTVGDLLKQPSEWLRGVGPVSDIVMSSRIRLARNLEGFPFATRSTKGSQRQVLMIVKEGMMRSAALDASLFFEMGELDEVDRHFLVERHLISREHVSTQGHKAVAIGVGEVISIMVNEEDHLRLQVMQSGLNLHDAWSIVDELDDQLSETLPYAYSTDWGYLTCCPTNTGTGMRASVMVHLPALVLTKQTNKVLHTITKLGLTARGFYGEGTEAFGNFFQISNQIALGRSEEELIENLERILKEVIHQEQAGREMLMASNRIQLEDRIWRAFGILKHAKTMSSNEALDLLSALRLGVDLELLDGLTRATVNGLFLFSQPAHLQKLEGKTLTAKERDTKRAHLIRLQLSGQA